MRPVRCGACEAVQLERIAMASPYRIHDERFLKLILPSAQLECLWTGGRWIEGPAYFPAGRYLIWSDIPNDRLLRYDETDGSVSDFRRPCGYENGHTVDREGRLVSCEHQARCLSRTEHDGSRTVLADRFAGHRLNSPNDVVVKSDGSIWFTDPTYGIDSDYEGDRAESEIGSSNVYRLEPESGSLTAAVTDMVRPNGLAFSPDERVLYVTETGISHRKGLPVVIRAYDVSAGGETVDNGRTFATLRSGVFDGLRVDAFGNVWTSAGRSVRCYAPGGVHLGTIALPEAAANLCFGGQKRNRLYICAHTSLYAIYVNARGAP
jgi:gluconolactonase